MGIRKRGENFFIDFYVNGERVREMIGPDEKKAERVLIQRKAEVLTGKYHLPAENKVTFAEVAKQYLEWSREHKRSWFTDESLIRHLLPHLGDKRLSQITPWHVEQIKHQLLKKQLSKPRVNRYLACLSGLFHRAQDWGLLAGDNPLRRVKRFRENPGRLRYLEEDEIVRLLNASNGDLRAAVLLALGTGMRRGEIFSLRWESVDLRSRIVHVEDSKNGERRDIPLGDALSKALDGRRPESGKGLVFGRADDKPCLSMMRTAWDRACKRAELPGLRFHDLRHTFASHLVMGGASLFAVQELLGHKTLAMTRRYSHLAPGVLREAVARMDHLLSAQEKALGTKWAQSGLTADPGSRRNAVVSS